MLSLTPAIAWIFLALLPLSSRAAPIPAYARYSQPPFESEVRHGSKRQFEDLVLTETRTVTTLETSTDVVTAFITVAVSASVTIPSPTGLASVNPQVHFVGDAPAVADAETILFLPDVSVQVGVSVSAPSSSTTAPAPQSTTASLDSDTATATSELEATTEPDTVSNTPTSTSTTPDALDSTSTSSTDDSDDASATDSLLPLPSPTPDDSDPDDGSSNSTDAPPAIAATPPPLKGPIIAAYYPDWVSDTLPPESINFTHLDWVDFAFGMPDAKFNIAWDDDSSTALLSRLVKAAHANNKKVKLSLGGWGGSKYFSPAVASTSSRQTFAKNIAAVYKKYSLDGIDIDWEYPGQQGAGGNQVSPQDSANLLAFLKVLRTTLPSGARITAAVQDVPFADASGNPMKDVSAFANVLDWVNLMNYDVWSSSKTPGPNAPLDNGCGNSSQPQMNAISGVKAWTSAKFPVNKIILGVPAYGYLNPSSKTSLRQRSDSDPSDTLTFEDNARTPAPKSMVTLKDANGNPSGAQVQFNSIVDQGALILANSTSGVSNFVGYGGFTRFWDSCSSTPFLVSPYTNQVVTYDDPQSLNIKADFAKQAGILGVAVWDVSGDTKQSDLIDALWLGLQN
ncbi:glycoside hydrolase [Schizopora paradoxa]|uniref:Glycoside hydrolase n=1 Tax=Schizopora paradoxa TaxID=27342 RepID=A0A0H2RV84_9AGAM|nr:glycoside hydrolase [Schizopora paradoxa]